ncbi:hypothetical protein [Maledivibacter halophilus]|uniref:Uncharacterized protein n=1 Tax=Maledivibacter halophilus TaxID=36842 RepID=A0A1T5M686_9FIRM|nr:hypothetical protein [Maledivibacter halophilus]SKC83389.1 hypothetical protein SAMN02194393_03901 [Maledivibacter halophilus]
MKKITIGSQNNNIEIDSEDIKNIIESFDGVGEVKNVSDSISEDIMVFNIILNSDYVEDLLGSQIEDLDYSSEDENQAILYEQAEYISDALVDNIREFLESRYKIDNCHGAYDIYRASLEQGIGLTLTLSFGQVKHGRLYKLASNINDRHEKLN